MQSECSNIGMQEWKVTPLTDWVNQNLFINQQSTKKQLVINPQICQLSVNNHFDKKFIVYQWTHFVSYIIILEVVRLYKMLKPHKWLDVGGNQSAWRKPLKSGWDPLKLNPGTTLLIEEGGVIHFARLTLLLWEICRRNCQFHDVLHTYIYLQLGNKGRV